MEERQSRLSNMDWKRFRPYLCVRLIPQNSMFSNFCHALNAKTKTKHHKKPKRNTTKTKIQFVNTLKIIIFADANQ